MIPVTPWYFMGFAGCFGLWLASLFFMPFASITSAIGSSSCLPSGRNMPVPSKAKTEQGPAPKPRKTCVCRRRPRTKGQATNLFWRHHCFGATLLGWRPFLETMLTGQVLVHWDLLGTVLGEKNTLFRCELKTGTVLVGLMIPQDLVACIRQRLLDRTADSSDESTAERPRQPRPIDTLELSDGESDSVLSDDVQCDAPRMTPSGPPQKRRRVVTSLVLSSSEE
ncbi:unnamed protein product [Durusdinium trenchii]|uniref:Uncharacterized protein n=1 Tax=Durusdinium trenchii TaxID=1381693 RepID=A0ABP0QNH3_9DINO